MDMTNKTYQDGLIEGRLLSLENMVGGHADRMDAHAKRLQLLERVFWTGLGIISFFQLLPMVSTAMKIMVEGG